MSLSRNLRELLDILHPRTAFLVIAGIVVLHRVRPEWRQPTFAARRHWDQALLIATVLAAFSLFVSEPSEARSSEPALRRLHGFHPGIGHRPLRSR
jgi:hypothetical protein